SNPALMPTTAHTTVAIANARTMLLSYLNVSTSADEAPAAFSPGRVSVIGVIKRFMLFYCRSSCVTVRNSEFGFGLTRAFEPRFWKLGIVLRQHSHRRGEFVLKLPRPDRPDEPCQKRSRQGHARQN